jgi:hypothetical protein
MEKWKRLDGKARRGWKQSRAEAQEEIERRAARRGRIGSPNAGSPNKRLKNDARKKTRAS